MNMMIFNMKQQAMLSQEVFIEIHFLLVILKKVDKVLQK
jgi:hypothetical protein